MAGLFDFLSSADGQGLLSRLSASMEASGPASGARGSQAAPGSLLEQLAALYGSPQAPQMAGLPGQGLSGGAAPMAGLMAPPNGAAPMMPPDRSPSPQGSFVPPLDPMRNLGLTPGFNAPVDQSMLPPNSEPTAGGPMPAAQAAPQAAPAAASPSFFERLGTGISDNSNALLGFAGGLASGRTWGQGLGQGFNNFATLGALDTKQANLAATYNALIQAGINPAVAKAAAANPEFLKSLAPQIVGTKPTFGKIGTDPFGRDQMGFIDASRGTVTPYQQGGSNASTLIDPTLTGIDAADALKKTSPSLYAEVQGMLDGRSAPPAGNQRNNPLVQTKLALAAQIDPGFDFTQWGGRQTSVKDFSAGKSSEMVRAANQTVHHVGSLIDSMDALNNKGLPIYNAAGNYLNEATGGTGPIAFRQKAHAVADEMSKVFKGAGISDAEIRQWEQNLSPNMSPAQQRESVASMMTLLNGSLQALEQKRVSGMGQAAADRAGPLIKEDTQKVLEKVSKWMGGTASPATAAAPAAAPKAVASKAEFDALPSGTQFVAPDGSVRVKP